jgi:hypothetical protein
MAEKQKYEIWYQTRDHLRHQTETLAGTWKQLLDRVREMALDGKGILAIGKDGIFRPYRLSTAGEF